MRKFLATLAAASALGIGLATAPTLDAHESQGSRGSTMGPGMMGQGGMMGGMMNMMGQMMEQCSQMMQGMTGGGGSGRPNDQWRKEAPKQPDKDG